MARYTFRFNVCVDLDFEVEAPDRDTANDLAHEAYDNLALVYGDEDDTLHHIKPPVDGVALVGDEWTLNGKTVECDEDDEELARA